METPSLVAVVEDDPEIRALVAGLFTREGFEAAPCNGGEALTRLMAERRPDLIVMDVMMPGEDGLSICRRLSAANGPPIIRVTARSEDIDRIIGLEIGADDYVAKPFQPRELVARARAVLRRTRPALLAPPPEAPRESFRFEGWTLDLAARALADPGGRPVELSAGDYDLLTAFLEHPQRVLSRDFLMDWTKGRDSTPFARAIDVALSRLRRKLGDDPAQPRFIRTVRNGGYLFAAAVTRG